MCGFFSFALSIRFRPAAAGWSPAAKPLFTSLICGRRRIPTHTHTHTHKQRKNINENFGSFFYSFFFNFHRPPPRSCALFLLLLLLLRVDVRHRLLMLLSLCFWLRLLVRLGRSMVCLSTSRREDGSAGFLGWAPASCGPRARLFRGHAAVGAPAFRFTKTKFVRKKKAKTKRKTKNEKRKTSDSLGRHSLMRRLRGGAPAAGSSAGRVE